MKGAAGMQQSQQCISVIEIGKAGTAQEPLLPLPVGTRPRETPVNIPNTTVKAGTADCTTLGTAWETRWLPAFFQAGPDLRSVLTYMRTVRPLDLQVLERTVRPLSL